MSGHDIQEVLGTPAAGEHTSPFGSVRFDASGAHWQPEQGASLTFAEGSRVQLSQWAQQAPQNWLERTLRRTPRVARWLVAELRSREGRVAFRARVAQAPPELLEHAPELSAPDAIEIPESSLLSLLAASLAAGAHLARGGAVSEEAPLHVRDTSQLFFSEGLAASELDAGWCYVDSIGRVVLPGPYRSARAFSSGRAAVHTESGWGFIDKEGQAVGPQKFERVRDFKKKEARVYYGDDRDGQRFFLQLDGTIETRPKRFVFVVAIVLMIAMGIVFYFIAMSGDYAVNAPQAPTTQTEPEDNCFKVETCTARCEAGEALMCFKAGQQLDRAKRGKASVPYYKRACDQDIAASCHILAFHHTGETFVDLLRKGCRLGHETACHTLVEYYDKNPSVDVPLGEAAEVYTASCLEPKAPYYCAKLAGLYEEGRGVKQDEDRAAEIYGNLCDKRGPYCNRAAALWIEGGLSSGTPEKAARIFDAACPLEGDGSALPETCGSGCLYACYHQARMRWRGMVVEQNKIAAVELFHDVCEAGAPVSCNALKEILDICKSTVEEGAEVPAECARLLEL